MAHKESFLTPNGALRLAREERGWSQQQVAALVGTSTFTVCRWERGQAFPGPHYRQKLCEVFGKTLGELELITRKQRQDTSDQKDIDLPQHNVWRRAAPPPRTYSGNLIGRADLLKQVREHLQQKKNIALCGLPGAGKTALALELAHSEEIQTLFPDGILWIRLGQMPALRTSLSIWSQTLGLTLPEISQLDTVLALQQELIRRIANRSLLFIIDDAWDIHHALACKVGGGRCSHLLTTRLPSLAVQFAHEGAIRVPPLPQAQALQLLTQLIPGLSPQEQPRLATLAQTVGGLPLALTLMGHYLQSLAFSGHPRRIQTALKDLQMPGQRFKLAELYDPAHLSLTQDADAVCSLYNALHSSIRRLSPQTQAILRTLALCASNYEEILEDEACKLCSFDCPSFLEHLDILVDNGLLECTSDGACYKMHPVVVDYFRLQG